MKILFCTCSQLIQFDTFNIQSPHCTENRFIVRFVVGPVAEPPETPTHLSMLSDSVMRTPALNELSDDKEGGYRT